MANTVPHLGVLLSTMETQLDKTTETLSTIVTAKVSLSKISALTYYGQVYLIWCLPELRNVEQDESPWQQRHDKVCGKVNKTDSSHGLRCQVVRWLE